MPLKNGELSGPEIRVLIRGHNKLAQIKVPLGLDRDGLIKFLKSRKYTVDHKNKRLVDTTTGDSRGRITTLSTAKTITKPKPKTDEQKATTKAKKDMKAKATKDKEDAIKAEGVKQGAALQKVVSKRVKAKALAKEDEVRPKEKVGKVKFDPKKVKVIGVKGSTKPKKKEEGDRGPDGSGIADLHKKAKVLTPKIWDELNTKYKIGKPIQDRYKSLIANEKVRDIRYKLGEGPGMGRGTEGISLYWDVMNSTTGKWAYMMGKTNKITPNKKSGGDTTSEEDKINQLKKNVNEQKFDLTIETRREMAKYFSYNSKKDTTSDGMPGVPYWKLKPKFK